MPLREEKSKDIEAIDQITPKMMYLHQSNDTFKFISTYLEKDD